MQNNNLIAIAEFCQYHQAEVSFIYSLRESGLIDTVVADETDFLRQESLPDVEKMLLMHYQMDINIEGIEAIVSMLQRMKALQDEMNSLKNRLLFYEH